jgi:hypothetical protein
MQSPKALIDQLMDKFFAAVSFEKGARPDYDGLRTLFLDRGQLIKSSGAQPEIMSIDTFIAPRMAQVMSGELEAFCEVEIVEHTDIFGNIAQRFSVYRKTGVLGGSALDVLGIITTQFVHMAEGWRISSMAWDDERVGLSVAAYQGMLTRQMGDPKSALTSQK